MFENFEWQGLESIKKSNYRSYIYDIKVTDDFDYQAFIKEFSDKLKHTDFFLSEVEHKFIKIDPNYKCEQEANKALVIKSGDANDKTYMCYDLKTLEGHAKPYDAARLANLIKSCSQVKSVNLCSEKPVYILNDNEYDTLIIKQVRALTDMIRDEIDSLPNNRNKSYKTFEQLGLIFSLNHSIPREGNPIVQGEIDFHLIFEFRDVMQIEHTICPIVLDKEAIARSKALTEENIRRGVKPPTLKDCKQ